ncbi:NADH-quinone oxidoreductase subunit M [Enemella sp. A6]|uniref:NADH-quinone oxidoreductase subunit M n=1 Tax=Enemella sp. A6 TaxID=3440152 RepID=UPI003EBB4FFD
MTIPWLTILGVVPLIGALALVFIKGNAARLVGLAFAVITAAIAIALLVQFQFDGGMQFTEQVAWIPAIGAWYSLGLDGLGLTLVLLTALLVPFVMIAGWDDAEVTGRGSTASYFALVLMLQGLSMFVFTATDVLLFYLFFEATLIPMYFLIGRMGLGGRRGRAAVKFLLFSLAGGLIMLAAVIGLYAVSAAAGNPTYLLEELAALNIDGEIGRWLFVGFFIAFAVKAPMVPVHSWLPDAAEEGHAGSSALLVGVLDKIGTFGMIRFCLGLFPEASTWATPVVLVLALISILWGAIAALGQRNLMRLIAFTSVSHFGFIVLGIWAFTTTSMSGSIFYMLNHGFSTAVMFLVAGYLVRRRGTAEIAAFGGVQTVAPVLAGVFLVGGLSTISLPGMSSFVSEFMVLAGTFSRFPVYGAIAALGLVLAAAYILVMYKRTMTGPVPEPVRARVTDLTARERFAVAPLIVLILALGFFPKPMLDVINPASQDTLQAVGVVDPEPQIVEGSN